MCTVCIVYVAVVVFLCMLCATLLYSTLLYSTLLYSTLLYLDSSVSAAPCSYIVALLALQLLIYNFSFKPSPNVLFAFFPSFPSLLFLRLISSTSYFVLFLPLPQYPPLPPSSLPPLPPLFFSPLRLSLSSLPFSLLLVPQDHSRPISTLSVRTSPHTSQKTVRREREIETRMGEANPLYHRMSSQQSVGEVRPATHTPLRPWRTQCVCDPTVIALRVNRIETTR
jgi:hypothetical protein